MAVQPTAVIDEAKVQELEQKFDPEMRFRPTLPPAAQLVEVAADRPVLLPLLHRRLRPAARDHAPRHPPGVRAGSDLPRLRLQQGGAGQAAQAELDARRAACRWSTGRWRVAVALSVLYIPYVFDDLAFRVGNPDTLDVVMGSVLVVAAARGNAPHDGLAAADHRPRVHGVFARRAAVSRAAQACGQRLAAARQPPVPDEPGHLRHRRRRGRDLRVPLRALRRARDPHRPGPAVPRHRRLGCRPLRRRSGQGVGVRFGDVRHAVRLVGGQRGDRRFADDSRR